jgi:hypothetical protein
MYRAKPFALLLLVAAALLPGKLCAAPVKLLLLDDMSCAAWSKAGTDPEQQQPYIGWIRGFLSGHNYASQARQVSVVSNGTIVQFVDRHCRSNPTSNVADAAMRMSDQYSGRNAAITK